MNFHGNNTIRIDLENSTRMKKVIVKHGVGQKLAEIFECSLPLVSQSLNYHPAVKDNLKSRKIRKVAKEQFGGIEIEV